MIIDKKVHGEHSENTISYIGKINLPQIGLCNVQVYNFEDDRIPHIHIFNEDNSFYTCICIYEPMYYIHDKIKNIFTQEQKEVFNKWIFAQSELINNKSNWEVIQFAWNVCNNMDIMQQIPDYTILHYCE